MSNELQKPSKRRDPTMLDVLLSVPDTAASALRGGVKNFLGAPGDIWNLYVAANNALPNSTVTSRAVRAIGPTKYGSQFFGEVLPEATPISSYQPTIPRQETQSVVEDLLGPFMLGPANAAQKVAGRAVTKAGEPFVPALQRVQNSLSEAYSAPGLPMTARHGIQQVKPREAAEEFADRVRAMGLQVDKIEHSGSAAGPSSYVTISNPITGEKLNPVRISSHGKGAWQNQFVNDVPMGENYGKWDFSEIEKALSEMANKITPEARDAYQQRVSQFLQSQSGANSILENSASQARPIVFAATKEARDSGVPWQRVFTNSGRYLGNPEINAGRAASPAEMTWQSGKIDSRLLAALGLGSAAAFAGNSLLNSGKKKMEDAKKARQQAIEKAEEK